MKLRPALRWIALFLTAALALSAPVFAAPVSHARYGETTTAQLPVPAETETYEEMEAPTEAEAPAEAEAPTEAEVPAEAGAPAETEAPTEAEAPISCEASEALRSPDAVDLLDSKPLSEWTDEEIIEAYGIADDWSRNALVFAVRTGLLKGRGVSCARARGRARSRPGGRARGGPAGR